MNNGRILAIGMPHCICGEEAAEWKICNLLENRIDYCDANQGWKMIFFFTLRLTINFFLYTSDASILQLF